MCALALAIRGLTAKAPQKVRACRWGVWMVRTSGDQRQMGADGVLVVKS